MAKYNVYMRNIPSVTLGSSDVVFDVHSGKEKIGSLCVSKGNVVWRPVNNTYGYWLKWSKFSEILEANGTRSKVNF